MVERFLREHGPLHLRILGPFVGRKNTGRIYLPVIPEMIRGQAAFGRLQAALGLPVTNFYAVGLFNLAEELNPAETRELSALIGNWQDEVLLETRLSSLQILGTHDDLACPAGAGPTSRPERPPRDITESYYFAVNGAESDIDTWQEARLIPTSGINGGEEQERRATSALLAVMGSVKEFGRALTQPWRAGRVVQTSSRSRSRTATGRCTRTG